MNDRPDPVPVAADPSTWVECLAAGCIRRVDPAEHSFRCLEHRTTTRVSRVAHATTDQAVDALDELARMDDRAGWRLLVTLARNMPTLICQTATAETDRLLEAEHRRARIAP